jgi:long-chain acyl-CoA synthetase
MEKTINIAFKNRVNKYQDRLAVEKKLNGIWESATWNQYYDRARAVGLAIVSMGVKKGDRIAILSDNRLEWLYTDMGGLGVGAVIVPIYPTLTKDEVQYIIENSDSKIFVVENSSQVEKALHAIEKCPLLEKIVVMDTTGVSEGNPNVMSFKELLNIGQRKHEEDNALFEKLAEAIEPEDLATIVYTSGTTGVPKGAMITHKNIIFVVQSLSSVDPPYARDTDQTVPFLPISHVFGRIADHFMGLYSGVTASFAESIDTLLEDFSEKKPTMIMAVPRVCEKVYQKIMAQVQEQSKFKQSMFYWGQKVGARVSELRELKKPIPFLLGLKYKIAYALIFQKLQDKLGGQVRYLTASGGPTARDIVLFFNSAGINVVEGYGMTECTAPATMSNLSDYRIGTVGPPIPGLDIKIADDGEILLKGDNVFSGYWKMEEKTQNAFTKDGYFKSGDIGEFDDRGFLKITDRKKDLIITSGGKNIAPQKIEGLFKFDPLFLHFIVIGERKKFLSALVNINMLQAEQLAKDSNIPFNNPEDLLENKEFLVIVDQHVAKVNTNLARFETIKKYRIVKDEFTQETGELTASLKMKRNVINEKHKDLIDTMYMETSLK